jgi:hypothetical protein
MRQRQFRAAEFSCVASDHLSLLVE